MAHPHGHPLSAFVCSLDGLLKCVDIETQQLVSVFECLTPVRCMSKTAAEDFNLLYAGGTNGVVYLYDQRTTRCLLAPPPPTICTKGSS